MKWVLLDVSYLAHRARHSLRGLEFEDYATGVLFGFFEQLRSICTNKQVNSNRIALFFDSKRSHRSKAYPNYKKKRRDSRTPEEKKQLSLMWGQVRLLYRTLPDLGIPVYRQTGLESDDLIAYAASKYPSVMITSDQDLYQAINEHSHWFDPGRARYYDQWSFVAEKRIDPARWGEVKAIAGCSSDNVAGVHKVGEKSAIKYLNGSLPPWTIYFKRIERPSSKPIIERNRELVILPHAKTKPFELIPPEFNEPAFFEFAERYGIVSYLTNEARKEWRSFFRDNRVGGRRRGERRG